MYTLLVMLILFGEVRLCFSCETTPTVKTFQEINVKIFSFLTVSWNINHTLLKTMLWPFCCSRAVYEWEHKLHAHASARGTDLHPVRSWQILKGCKFKPPFFEVWGKGNDCFNWHLMLLTGVFICDCGFFFFFFFYK